MKEGWKEVKLSDLIDEHIIELKRGKVIAKTKLSNEYEYPVYSASAQGNGLLGYSNEYDLDEELITWSVDGGGRPFYRHKHKFSVTNVCGYARILDQSVLNYKFLYYCMQSEWMKNTFDYSHKAHPSVIKDLYNILIPPLDEQLKIAKVLSEVEDLEHVHSAKADVLSRMKEHLMDNKSGIIEKERNRSEFDRELLSLQSEIEKNIKINFSDVNSNNLDTRIRLHRDNLDKINYIVELITYIGEDEHYERERESLTHGTPWVTCKLGDLCTVKTGKLNANAAVEGGEYPFFTCSKQDYRIDQYSFDGEALLISGNGDVGNVKYYNGKFDAYQRTYVLMGFKLDAKYLYYYLKESMPKRARDMLNGSAVPYIKLNCITDFEISYPEDIEEQKRIAKVLSDLDELSRLHSLKVDELSKMKEHLMDNKSGIIENERNKQENNEWGELKLSEIFDTRNGYTPSKQVQEYWENGDIPWFRIEDIRENGHILNDSLQHINKLGVKGSGLFPENSIILSTSATIGEHALIKVPCLTNQRFVCFSLKKDMQEKFDIEYLYWYFYIIGNWCRENAIQGSTFLSVDIPMLKEQTIKFPKSISEQKRIAKMLSEYDSMVASQEQLISIIQREREFMRQAPQIIIRVLSGEQLN